MDIALDEPPIESCHVVAFLRQWSELLPELETQCRDPAHPVRRALCSLLPPQRLTGDEFDPQQAAALAGLCLFVPHRGREVVAALPQLAALQSTTDVVRILAQVAQARHSEDPAAHLFEMMLAQSAGDTRRRRGVYFTPQPLVRFIVHSVDAVLRDDFDIEHGLNCSSSALNIVDPACGTGVFLTEVLRQRKLPDQRLVGIDVMPACCAAVRLILADRPPTVHCANALQDVALSESVLLKQPGIPIVIGNPPYSNFGRKNQGDWIGKQLLEYKSRLDEQKINLDDDFIKFLRWGQYWIDRVGRGVLAMVTNNTYLRGLTHRQMRASLLGSFDRAYFVDLQGDRKRNRTGLAANRDENIFDIQQGVAVCVLVRTGRHLAQRTSVARLAGSKSDKLRTLANSDIASIEQVTVTPKPPLYFFQAVNHAPQDEQYLSWPPLNEIFTKYTSGVQTKRDALFTGFTAEDVAERMQSFLEGAQRDHFSTDIPDWLRKKSRGVRFDRAKIRHYMVAPFDVRWIYYDPKLLGRARFDVMRHLQKGNYGLVFMRQSTNIGTYDHFLATSVLVSDRVFYSAHGAPFCAPLMLHGDGTGTPNFSSTWLKRLEQRLGLRLGCDMTVHDIFHWIYAVVHCREYRTRFSSLLRIGYPRIPWPASTEAFRRATPLGKQLVDLHLAACRASAASGHATENVDCAGVNEAIQQFQIGGYAVLPRWIKQRRRRTLTPDEANYRQNLIDVIQQSLSITEGIDRAFSASCPW
jgi:predicted helicase